MNYTVSECVYVREKQRARGREREREKEGEGEIVNAITVYPYITDPGLSHMYVVNGGNHTLMHVLYTCTCRYVQTPKGDVYCMG